MGPVIDFAIAWSQERRKGPIAKNKWVPMILVRGITSYPDGVIYPGICCPPSPVGVQGSISQCLTGFPWSNVAMLLVLPEEESRLGISPLWREMFYQLYLFSCV